jgi:hypothetical protein
MNEIIYIKDALKIWYGLNYNDNDYNIYLIMKKYNCYAIFCCCDGLLIGDYLNINLNDDTINKIYFNNILKKYLNKSCKIKNVWFEGNAEPDNDNNFRLCPYHNGIDDDNHILYEIY